MGWVTYKNLQVPSASTGDAGMNLTSDFQKLADGSFFISGADPTSSNDSTQFFSAGSLWINSANLQRWECISATIGAAAWVKTFQATSGALLINNTVGINTSTTYAPLTVQGGLFSYGGGFTSDFGSPSQYSTAGTEFACDNATALLETEGWANACVIAARTGTAAATRNTNGLILGATWGSSTYFSTAIQLTALSSGNVITFFIGSGTAVPTQLMQLDSTGRLGVGVTPAAYLNLRAGTATAGTSPLKLTSGTSLTTPEAGAVEYDGSKLYFTAIGARRSINLADGVITSSTSVANTTTETTAYTDTLPANEMTVGRVLRVTLLGRYSTANATNTFTLRLKLGTTTLISIASTAASVTNVPLKVVLTATVRSTGGSGTVFAFADATINHTDKSIANTATTTIDTTAAENVVATVQWSAASASNSVSLDQAFVEFLN